MHLALLRRFPFPARPPEAPSTRVGASTRRLLYERATVDGPPVRQVVARVRGAPPRGMETGVGEVAELFAGVPRGHASSGVRDRLCVGERGSRSRRSGGGPGLGKARPWTAWARSPCLLQGRERPRFS